MESNRGEKGFSMDDMCGDAILIIDMNGSIVKTNQDACRALGLSEPEIIGIGLPGILAYIQDLPGKNDEPIEWEIIPKKTADQDGTVLIIMTLREARSWSTEGAALEEKFHRLHDTMLQGVVYQDSAGKIISYNPAAARILGWDDGFLGSSRTSVSQEMLCIREDGTPFPGLEHPAMVALETGKAVLGVVMGVYNPIMEMYRWIVIDAVPLCKRGVDRPYQVYTMFYDVTEKKVMEEAILRSQRRKGLLADVSNQLLRYEDPLKIIDDIGHKMMDFLKCDVFFNYMVNAEQGRLELNAYGGIPASEAAKIRWLDFGVAVCGMVAVSGERTVVEDIDVNRPPGTDLVWSYGVQAYACNPIIAQGKTIGTLSFGSKAHKHFSEDEIAVMDAMTDQIAIAMERMKTTKALRESEAKYRALFENIHEQVGLRRIIFDDNGYAINRILLDANPALLKVFGASSMDEVRGKTDFDLLPGDMANRLLDEMRTMMETGNYPSREINYDGHDYLVKDALIEKDLWVSSSSDITDLKRAQNALLDERNRLKTILDSLPVGVMVFGSDGNVTIANKTITDFLIDLNPHWKDAPNYDLIKGYRTGSDTPLSLDEWPISKVMSGAESVSSMEIEFLDNHGRRMTTLCLATPIKDNEGILLGGIMAFVDITKQKLAEAMLKESEQRLRFHFENTPMAVIEWDSEFKVIRWAGEAERMFGWAASEVLGQRIDNLNMVIKEDIPIVESTMARLTSGERQVVSSNRNNSKDGKIMYCTWYNSVLTDEQGRMTSVMSLVLDNTPQYEAESMARESTRELQRSNAELQQFAYLASHDLQEPLRMVVNYLSLLESRYKDSLDPKGLEYIRYAVEGGVRMRDLIRDLLEYSRVNTTGKQFTSVDMNDVVNKTLSLLKVPIEESRAEIIVEALPTVLADGTQMIQVFQNLIGNAIKFRGDFEPKIIISVDEKEDEWIFAIKDNGIGIDMELADQIFLMFHRLHTRDEHPGTGIGLAISKKIIERHNGKIWVESDGKNGSTFFFTIPRTYGDEFGY